MAHQLLQVFSTQFDCHQFITLSVLLCFQQDERDAEPHTVRLQQLRLVMVALCNRADHYIFILFLPLLSNSFFFPHLISAIGNWMFTILWHMMWP